MNRTTTIGNIVRTVLFAAGISALSLPALAEVVFPGARVPSVAATKTARSETGVLPPALRPVVYQSLAKGCATLPGEKFTACFSSNGAHFTGASSLALHLVSYGRGEALSPVKSVQPVIRTNRVDYAYGNLAEWWRVLPIGFEQGFTIAKRPAGHGELTLALAANSQADQRNGALGWGKLRYGQLVVSDAKGKMVPATLKSKGDRILIAINDAHAVYPLTVDPLVWLEQEVTGSDVNGDFGYMSAINGTTALISAPGATVDGVPAAGTVYAFNESNGVWSQTQQLIPSDVASLTGASFGYALALNGTTAIIGAYTATVNGNTWEGKAYVFTEADGTWTQTQEFTPSDAPEYGTFGVGVAIGNNVAFIGAGGAFVNGNTVPASVYVFEKSNGTWTQTQKIPSPNQTYDGFGFGQTIGISETTAVVGAGGATVNGNLSEGNVTVYTESNGTWTQTQQLTGSDSGADSIFGSGVAIQGNTLLIGSESVTGTGTVYVFTNSGGTWTQAQELSPNDGVSGEGFGGFVALDGATALIGANYYNNLEGKAYIFTNENGTWTQTQELFPSDHQAGGNFGFYGALSVPTALTGASRANGFVGAAYFYGESNLGLALSAPETVGQGQQYVSQTIATNNGSAASPAVTATVTVPAAASFVSASASQGTCSEDSGRVTCDFGAIDGNAGTATANVTLKATGDVGDTIENLAGIAKATPPLSASAPTTITAGGACPDGYSEYDGSLNPGGVARSPVYQAPGGEENAILTAPERFQLYAVYQSGRFGRHIYLVPGNEVHRWGPKGLYMWLVRARDGSGAYTLCLQHP